MLMTSTTETFFNCLVIKQGYIYHKIRKGFPKFYHRHSESIDKYNIGLKTLQQQGISEPIFYADLVYKFKRIVGKPIFSEQFKNIIKRCRFDLTWMSCYRLHAWL